MSTVDWNTVTLGEVAELDVDRVAVEADSEYRLAGVFIAGRGLFWRDVIRGRETKYSMLNRLRTGQLVMRKLTAWEGPITTVPAEFDGGYVSSEFPTFTLDESQLLPEYMRLICRRPEFHGEMRMRATGTAERRNRLKPEDLLSIQVDLPPLDEQARIVRALTAIDDAIASAEVECFAAGALRRVLLSDVYEELRERADEMRPLGELADVASGMAWSRDDECEASDGVPALRVANVQLDGVDLSELRYVLPKTPGADAKILNPDSLILVRTNTAERVGNAQFLPEEAIGFTFSSFLIQVTPKSSNDLGVIARSLQAPDMQSQMTARARGSSASLTNIPVTWLRELEIPIVPEPERLRLLEPIDAVEMTVSGLRAEIEQLDSLRRSLLSALLSRDQRLATRVRTRAELTTS